MADFIGTGGSAPGALGRVQHAMTGDVDEQAALLRGWNQTYDQLSPGGFNGSFQETDLGPVQMFREITSSSLHQTGALPKGMCALGIPLNLKGNATFCGTACDGTQLHIFSGGSGFEFYSPEGLDIVGVVVREDAFLHALSLRDFDTFNPADDAHLRSTSRRCGSHLRETALNVLQALGETVELVDKQAMLASMSRDLLSALADAVSGDDQDVSLRIPQGKRWQIVRRAISYAREDGCPQVSVDDLCTAAGVSRRALQYCFNDVLGVTPAVYLKVLRLNGARRALKVSNTVTEAAVLWGFWHLGRFSADYNAMFGELPSVTFRKHHDDAGSKPRC